MSEPELGILLAVYFAPTIIASIRRHDNALGIGIVNAVLGVTVVGWVAALVWAVWQSDPKPLYDVRTGQRL